MKLPVEKAPQKQQSPRQQIGKKQIKKYRLAFLLTYEARCTWIELHITYILLLNSLQCCLNPIADIKYVM